MRTYRPFTLLPVPTVFVRSGGSYAPDPTTAEADQFTDPKGIAIDSYDNLYITDRGINRVSKWDSSGTHTLNWPSSGSTPGTALGHFNDPEGIAFTPGDGDKTPASILVVDSGNQRVEQFTPAGGNIDQFGGQGGNNGQFLNPIGIATVNQTGSGTNVFVADKQANTVRLVNQAGAGKVEGHREHRGRRHADD